MSLLDPIQSGLAALLSTRKVIVTCGTGGVGKTTLSAALAVKSSLLGKNTVVITIDPAKRLTTSLGIVTLGDTPTDITPRLFASGVPASAARLGSLFAIVPDTKLTFERFVKELSPDLKTTARILSNPIFQIFSREFSGANEYMALERLFELVKDPEIDCIILDTPPSRNTLDFLNAPTLLARFFDEKLIKLLLAPTQTKMAQRFLGGTLFQTGAKKVLGLLEGLTGSHFLSHLLDFAADLFKVQENFVRNLKNITRLLASSDVGFLMVTTPMPGTLEEAKVFIRSVEKHGFRFDGLAINRSLAYLKVPRYSAQPANKAIQILEGIQTREKEVIEGLALNQIPVVTVVPELKRDVHCLEDLIHVANYIS